MATLLQRLGLFSARHRWWVIAAWIAILGTVALTYATVGGALSTSLSIPGTPAQKVNDQLASAFPSAGGGNGQLVFSTRNGEPFTAAQEAAIADALSRAVDVDVVSGAMDPFVFADQRAAAAEQLEEARSQISMASEQVTSPEEQAALDLQAQVIEDQQRIMQAGSGFASVSPGEDTAVATLQFTTANAEIAPSELAQIRDAVIRQEIDGVTVEFDSAIADPGEPPGATEAIGVVIAAVVLFVMLGSLVAAGLPLVSAIVGVAVGAVGILSLSGVVEISSTTPILGVMLGLAVGIDYSLFILNRHRQYLRAGVPVRRSIGLATGTSGSAVLFAGMTVIIALAALNLTGIGLIGLMGTAGAICVAIAVLVALTLTPALLALADVRVLPKRERRLAHTDDDALATAPSNLGSRTAKGGRQNGSVATRHPVVVIVSGLLALLVLAVPAASLRLGLPDAASQPASSTQYKAYSQIGRAFGPGMNGPIVVVATLPEAANEAELTRIEADVADHLMTIPHVTAAALGGASEDNSVVVFQVIPAEGPVAASTEQLVKDLRAASSTLETDLGVTIGVTGLTAMNIDTSAKLGDALPLYLIVVLGLSILILVVVFRSILIPLIATAGFLLSILATLGIVTAVFQYGWGLSLLGLETPSPVLSFLPTLLVGIVFGLAMDYQLFLVSGMREAHVQGAKARDAVLVGLDGSKAVITAAALIMIGVFGGFALSQSSTVTPIGLGLGLGVLIDAFVVRMLLIPATMTLLGESAWWLPKRIDRILPDMDVEGSQLTHGPQSRGAMSA
ncbi:MMPL family transporter [Demequina sp. TTPB684]|uniref:MMPL family transporter n=1 Tax=unclassified Demequina TaxID=2620311 RepID=UPI001CF1FADE|nr:MULTISPECIES: MMPL family transporter [unclassified Demequina]MCB2412209.1 MMPL family transporter [Demequina sp. TTPB684]UPU87317.1 MMPL family transporter [Demequina sp. TMPB413]